MSHYENTTTDSHYISIFVTVCLLSGLPTKVIILQICICIFVTLCFFTALSTQAMAQDFIKILAQFIKKNATVTVKRFSLVKLKKKYSRGLLRQPITCSKILTLPGLLNCVLSSRNPSLTERWPCE